MSASVDLLGRYGIAAAVFVVPFAVGLVLGPVLARWRAGSPWRGGRGGGGSSRLEAEQRLAASEAEQRAFFQNTAGGMVHADPHTRCFLRANDAFTRITGYSLPELRRLTVGDITHPDDVPCEAPDLEQLLRGDIDGFSREKRYIRKDGQTIWVAVSVTAIRDETGGVRCTVAVVQDITEQKAAEQRLRALAASLEQRVAERTAELGAFSYTVSHDLRAPLRAMEGFANALLEDYAPILDEMGRHYARRIVLAANRMDALICDMLEYSQLSRADLVLGSVDPRAAIDEALTALASDIERSGARIEAPSQIQPVLAHRGVLAQVIQNLLANAIKFVSPGVTPCVRIEAALPRDGRVRLAIVDNGIGVAPEHRDRIFRVFERLHAEEQYPGTGIGLAIVRRAVERMGGAAGVISQTDRGSTFWIELPAANPES